MGENEMNVVQEEPKTKKSAMITAGLVLGIIGVCTCWIPIVNNASFFLGILAVIFGGIGIAKKMGGKAVAALVLGIAAIVVTLVMQSEFSKAADDVAEELEYIAGDKTQEILDDYLDVTIGSFTAVEDEYFDTTELVVKVKNKSKEKKSFSIEIEAIAEDGTRIDTDYIYANDLTAGQAQEFKIFNLVSSDKIPALKKATFRILEVSMY